MDFELTTEQAELQDAIRRQLAGRYPLDVVRSMEGGRLDRARWAELGQAGVFSLRLPAADGGVGLGVAEGVLVFEELGRALVPGPLVGTHLLATATARSAATAAAAGAATGTHLAGVLEADRRPLLVEHLDDLDALVVLDDAGLRMVEPAAVRAAATPIASPLDPLTPLHLLDALPEGERLGGPDEADSWRRDGALLTAALQLGIAEAVTDAAVAYAKERVQFDKPIGAFQAVKHLCADMLVRTEMARAAVYAAGVTVDDPAVGDPARAVAGAKVLAGEAALANAKANIQVHGGMGFTWEVEAHLFLKRAWVLDTAFGTVDDHAEALAGVL